MKHYVDRVERVIGVDINRELLAALERSYAPGKWGAREILAQAFGLTAAENLSLAN